jgi:hypothetical protein
MKLKIKTTDIELEYNDDYSIIEEDAKRRILEIINQIYVHEINSKRLPAISAHDFFDDLNNYKNK